MGQGVRMAREIPEVVRAAAGLAATVLDEARKLPETLPGLPVRIIGMAMQQAMKVQQQYAGFVARGDELFTGLRGEDEPGLATFDDDEPLPASTGFRESAFDRAAAAEPTADLIIEAELAIEVPGTDEILDEIAIDELVDQAPTLEETAPATPSPAASAPAKAAKAPVKAAPAKAAKAPAKAKPADKAPKPAKATKPRKPAKAAAPTQDAAATDAGETALLEAALAAPTSEAPTAEAPTAEAPAAETAPTETPTAAPTAVDAEPAADVATTVDVLTPAGDVAEVAATVTDEGVAAPESAEPAPAVGSPSPASETATTTATDEGGTPVAAAPAPAAGNGASNGSASSGSAPSSAPANPPVDGYDSFTVAQLRGRMRGYALSTVEELIGYEQATRARAPYLTMLRNRLEKLEEQAVESSPLAPRGA